MAAEYTVTREGEDAGAIVLRLEGRAVGQLDFRVSGSSLDINYVVVDPSIRGQGLGVRLVEAAVDWARETGRTVRPVCGYASRVLRTDVRFQDVLISGRS